MARLLMSWFRIIALPSSSHLVTLSPCHLVTLSSAVIRSHLALDRRLASLYECVPPRKRACGPRIGPMSKRIAIVQSNYIPWKGYFDLINSVDEFVLYDDMQYTRRDWRNRNKIKTKDGPQWLTIPVEVKGKYHQAIRETLIVDGDWGENHWRRLVQSY